jgi:hypothetical protein
MYFIVMLLIDKKGNADHVLNQLTTKPQLRMGEWRYGSTILDLGT